MSSSLDLKSCHKKTTELIHLFYQQNNINLNAEESTNNLKVYYEMILQKNSVMNLTSFHNENLWIHGIHESLETMFFLINNQNIKKIKILDIGSGAGFPSIPANIVIPTMNLVICEKLKKRVDFLKEVKEKFKLNVILENVLIEKLDLKYKFDLIVARAVAPLNKLIDMSWNAGQVGTKFAFVRGLNVIEEIEEAKSQLNSLKINIYKIEEIHSSEINFKIILFTFRKNI